jgi:uncharacterized delta-60 repeat protein
VGRLAPTGEPDVSFGSRGRTAAPFGPASNGFAGLALQPDGRIVAVGTATPDGSHVLSALARFDGGGNLDASFNGSGMLTTSQGDRVVAAAILPDGKILSVGFKGIGICLVRLNGNDGSFDASFDGDGVKIVQLDTGAPVASLSIGGLALQADGKFVVTGSLLTASVFNAFVARFTSAGILDLGYTGGFARYAPNSTNSFAGVALDSDGRVVGAGFTGSSFSVGSAKLVVARFWP